MSEQIRALGNVPMAISGADFVNTVPLTLYRPPRPVGFWVLGKAEDGFGGFNIPMYSKPTDEQIRNTEALLGWKWKDAK